MLFHHYSSPKPWFMIFNLYFKIKKVNEGSSDESASGEDSSDSGENSDSDEEKSSGFIDSHRPRHETLDSKKVT
jgi:hypothetical protein